jgi:dihydroxyacetone kinase-like protein
MAVTLQHILAWLEALKRTYAEQRQLLTELDAAIGDADHGINMERGFNAVQADLTADLPPDITTALKTTATVLLRSVGGASGPLYGTLFLRLSTACAGKTMLQPADVVNMFDSALSGVAQRGRAAPGDKTMLDALAPAVAAMQAALADECEMREMLQRAVVAAEMGMKATIPLQARKGRASYLGERSIGHQDPGATSMWLLFKAAAVTWSGESEAV